VVRASHVVAIRPDEDEALANLVDALSLMRRSKTDGRDVGGQPARGRRSGY